MALLGNNKHGEEVHSMACGGRCVMRDGKVLIELYAPFNPYDLISDGRFRTVMETVEAIRRIHSSAIDGIGVSGAVTAMLPYWETHFAEGHGTDIVVRDLEEVKRAIDAFLTDFKTTMDLPVDDN